RRLGTELDKQWQTSFTLDGELLPEQIAYAESDVLGLHQIARQQRGELEAKDLGMVWEIERACVPVFAEMYRVGVWIDLDIMQPLIEREAEKMRALGQALEVRLSKHVMWRRVEKFDQMQAELDGYLERLA